MSPVQLNHGLEWNVCRSTVRNRGENQRQHLAGCKSVLTFLHVARACTIQHAVAGWGDCLLSSLGLLSSWQRHFQAAASVVSLIFSYKPTTMCQFKVIAVSWYVACCFLSSSKMFPCCFHRDVTLQQGREWGVRILLRKNWINFTSKDVLVSFWKKCVEISVTNPHH